MATATLTTDTYPDSVSPLRELVGRLVGESLFWMVIVQLIAGIYLQSQLAVFNRIVLPNGAIKLLLLAALLGTAGVSVLVARGQMAYRRSLLPAGIFVCYLAADLAWLTLSSSMPLGALLFGFNKYFLFFAALPAAALLRPHLTERQMKFRLIALLVPAALLALAQFALNDPIFPTVVEDESFEIPAVEFFGRIRAFSIFRGVLECGQGMAFFGAMMVAQLCTQRERRFTAWLLLALSAAACFVTFRRGAYLEYGAAVLSAVAIARQWSITRWLPWLYLVMAIGLASAGTVLGSIQGEGMLSSASLSERHEAWSMAFEQWIMRQDASLLVGTGLAQTSLLGTGLSQIESHEVEYFLVDNGFLAVGAQVGIIGLVLWFWVMQSLWRDMLDTSWLTGSTLAIGVAALLSTWMMRDVFDPLFALYPLYAFLVFWTIPETPAAPEEAACR